MKCRLVPPMESGTEAGTILPAGTEIEHTDAWILVRMSVAEPTDEECRLKADMTPEKTEAARRGYERVSRGIAPEDYEAFDRGEMIGYFADGSPIPGPNAIQEETEPESPQSLEDFLAELT